MPRAIAFLVLVLSCSQFTGAQTGSAIKEQSVQTVDFCDLFRYPARYEGKTVKVTATYSVDMENAAFYDEGCRKSDAVSAFFANAKFSSNSGDKKLWKILRRQKLAPRLARVSMLAVFVDEWAGGHSTICPGCSRYTLEVTQILTAEKIKQNSPTSN